MRFDWSRVRSRAVTWAFVPALIVLVAAAVLAFFSYENSARVETLGRNRASAYLSASGLIQDTSKFKDDLDTVARAESRFGGRLYAQMATLSQMRRRLVVFYGVVVVLDNFGRVRITQPVREDIANQDWSDRFYFRRLLAGDSVAYSDVLYDGPGGAPVIVIAVPITSDDGEFMGALGGMFRLGASTASPFYASLVRLQTGRTGTVSLVDGNGRLVYHPDLDRIGESVATDPIVAKVIRGQLGAERTRNRAGNEVVVSYAPVPGTRWGLLNEQDWRTEIGRSWAYGRFLLLLLGLGIILPAAGFTLLARQRRAETLERARMDEQLRVARLIQHTLLPRESHVLPGWAISGHYQPAQAVGGDFYDYLPFEDGQMGVIIGDVTDKGVPAALVMATTRSLLRSVARQVRSPGLVLQRVNNLLDKELPSRMFVTCLYALLDPATGRVRFANAGHCLPIRSHQGEAAGRVTELRARGMPLGLMPEMRYEEVETTIGPGECLLFYSDGLVEARNPDRELLGEPRLKELMRSCPNDCPGLIPHLLDELAAFVGRGRQPEDDVTLVTVQRTAVPVEQQADDRPAGGRGALAAPDGSGWWTVDEFAVPSEPGNERQAMRRVAEAARALGLGRVQIDRLKTAVAEATMNAMEHGNHFRPEVLVEIRVLASEESVAVWVTDRGDGGDSPPPMPDLKAKMAGVQSSRGWGLFLIGKMVDQVNVTTGDRHHTMELVVARKGDSDDQGPAS